MSTNCHLLERTPTHRLCVEEITGQWEKERIDYYSERFHNYKLSWDANYKFYLQRDKEPKGGTIEWKEKLIDRYHLSLKKNERVSFKKDGTLFLNCWQQHEDVHFVICSPL